MKLVPRIEGKAGQGATGSDAPPLSGQTYRAGRRMKSGAGVVIDGDIYPLQGEPPIAQTQGWGDLTWLYRPRG